MWCSLIPMPAIMTGKEHGMFFCPDKPIRKHGQTAGIGHDTIFGEIVIKGYARIIGGLSSKYRYALHTV